MLPRAMEPSEVYHIKNDAVNMNFMVVVTLRASTVERWIRDVKRRYLDAAPMKIMGKLITSRRRITYMHHCCVNGFGYSWITLPTKTRNQEKHQKNRTESN